MNKRKGHGKILLVVISLVILLFSVPVLRNMQLDGTVVNNNTMTTASDLGVIVIDYSHGQESANQDVLDDDLLLASELEAMGYTVIWARGGLNSSVLSGADGLLIASIIHEDNAFLGSEIDAISNWFGNGTKFLWIGCDSDYTSLPSSGQFINDNMSLVLESVESHVYPEPTTVDDPVSHAGAAYRVIANQTSDDPFVSDIVNNVETVLMHNPTLVYGSNNELNPGIGVDPVALESIIIDDVYPLLYYGGNGTIIDYDLTSPIAHDVGDTGAFVATTIEINAGASESGVIVVSGASPYADYRSMHFSEYNGYIFNGSLFVRQTIDFGMKQLYPSIDDVPDVTYEEGSLGNYITWHPSSTIPQSYNITSDGALVIDGLWNSTDESIAVNVDYLVAGPYTYTLTVTDNRNKSASDTVFVAVDFPVAPLVSHPIDIEYTLGQVGNEIVWEISDASLLGYALYLNGMQFYISSEPLNSSISVIQDVDGLSVDWYNFTINVFDSIGLSTSDTVIVEVVSESTTTTTTTTTITTTTTDTTTTDTTTTTSTGSGLENLLWNMTFLLAIGSIVLVVIVIVLIFKKRN